MDLANLKFGLDTIGDSQSDDSGALIERLAALAQGDTF